MRRNFRGFQKSLFLLKPKTKQIQEFVEVSLSPNAECLYKAMQTINCASKYELLVVLAFLGYNKILFLQSSHMIFSQVVNPRFLVKILQNCNFWDLEKLTFYKSVKASIFSRSSVTVISSLILTKNK